MFQYLKTAQNANILGIGFNVTFELKTISFQIPHPPSFNVLMAVVRELTGFRVKR